MSPEHLTPLHPEYPSRLRRIDNPPASLTVRGEPAEAERTVAVIGSREASPAAVRFTGRLCRTLVRSGVVVVSGGAFGIDAAAHRTVLETGGRTWVVAGTGADRCFPTDHSALYDAVGRGPGAMIWPFERGYRGRSGFLYRNRVLVALSDAVVVVQAGRPSGALHAAGCARQLGRPLWVVPAPPWMKGFAGSRQLIEDGALPLSSIRALEVSLRLKTSSAGNNSPEDGSLVSKEQLHGAFSTEINVLSVMSKVPAHVDAIASRAQQSAQAIAAALLTLSLENVVVEGPPGFFRKRDP